MVLRKKEAVSSLGLHRIGAKLKLFESKKNKILLPFLRDRGVSDSYRDKGQVSLTAL